MKLLRYGPCGSERPGILDQAGVIRDLSTVLSPYDNLARLETIERLLSMDVRSLPAVDGRVRLGAPVASPSKIIACGLNYADHAAESGLSVGEEPTFFLKAPSALSGPNDPVVIPPGACSVDWEVELAAVVGREGAYLSPAEAEAIIAGYAVFNDVSERHNQFNRGAGQWVKGKSADSFGPLGPYLVTPDEVEVDDLAIWLDLNGRRMQASSTRHMIFSVAEIVSYVSQFMSLQPGDIVSTGTPSGVGMGLQPQLYLAPGDHLRLGIDCLGEQDYPVVAYTDRPQARGKDDKDEMPLKG